MNKIIPLSYRENPMSVGEVMLALCNQFGFGTILRGINVAIPLDTIINHDFDFFLEELSTQIIGVGNMTNIDYNLLGTDNAAFKIVFLVNGDVSDFIANNLIYLKDVDTINTIVEKLAKKVETGTTIENIESILHDLWLVQDESVPFSPNYAIPDYVDKFIVPSVFKDMYAKIIKSIS